MKRLIARLLAVLVVAAAPTVTRAQFVMDSMSLVAAIRVGNLTDEVAGVHDATTVYVARVSQLAGIRVNGDLLSRAIDLRERVIRYFRSAIRGAREAARILEIHEHTVDQVVWATHTNDGSATLYVDDR